MKISTFIIGLVLFTTLLTGMYWVVGGVAESGYTVTMDDPEQAATFAQMQTLTSDVQQQVESSQIEESNIFVSASKGAITATKLTFSSLNIFDTSMSYIADLLQLPAWAYSAILVIVSVMFIFAIIYAMNRVEI